MAIRSNLLTRGRIILLVSLSWLAAWILPWGKLPAVRGSLHLAFLTDMIRLEIAVGIFLVPGILLYLLLQRNSGPFHDWLGLLPIGFTLSVFMIASIGLLGRIAGLSFNWVKNLFALTGMIELILILFYKSDLAFARKRPLEAFKQFSRNPPLLAAVLLATLMTFHDYLFFIDDTSYLAYLMNWQHASRLGFINIVHESNVIENVRFWLALYPMGQALLSSLSGVPGILLLGNYLELFLVPIAVVSSYWFARCLSLSPKAAGFSVLLQVSLYTWMIGDEFPVGMWFYQNLAEDKVSAAFILAPVFFVFVLYFLKLPNRTNLLFVLLSGLSLTLTHPITLFFCCAIAGGLALSSWVVTKTRVQVIRQLIAILAISLLPYVLIRFSDIPTRTGMAFGGEQASETFQFDRYINVVNDVFYGLNPQVLQFMDLAPSADGFNAFQLFRLIPVVLAVLAGLISLIKCKKGPLYWYVLCCALLVLFVTIPYTGWIVGQLVSARVIPRAAWFSPLGLSGVLIFWSLNDWLKKRRLYDEFEKFRLFKARNFTFELLGISLCLLFAGPIVAYNLLVHGPGFFTNLDEYRQLAQVGAYIDGNTRSQVTTIALDYTSTQLLPGVSSHARLISFREETARNGFNGSFSLDEIRARTYASNVIRSLDIRSPAADRCLFIQRYQVRFVLAAQDNAQLYQSLIAECGITATDAFATKDTILLEIR